MFINVEGAVVYCREDAEIEDFIQIERLQTLGIQAGRLQTLGIQAGINAVMIHGNYFNIHFSLERFNFSSFNDCV